MTFYAHEKELHGSVGVGQVEVCQGLASANERATSRYAKATFRKDRRVNIRLSSKDLERPRSGRSPRACPTRR